MWISHRGGPADEPPTPAQVQRWHRRISPPENEFPAGVGLTVLLGRTNDAAVGITQIEGYSTGFQFTLVVRLRQARPESVRGGLLMLISSHVHPGIEIPVEDRLLLGLEYPNGHRASTVQDMRMLGPVAVPSDQQLVLVQQGGGGGEQSVNQTYWVSPLPPEGPVSSPGQPLACRSPGRSSTARPSATRPSTANCSGRSNPPCNPQDRHPHLAHPPDGSLSRPVDGTHLLRGSSRRTDELPDSPRPDNDRERGALV